MPVPPEASAAVKRLLEGLSDTDIREFAIEAFREWAGRSSDGGVSLSNVAVHLLPKLWERKGEPSSGYAPHQAMVFTDLLEEPWMLGFLEFIEWFCRVGFAVPRPDGRGGIPSFVVLTRAGRRFLQGSKDHPLLPGYLDRLVARCPQLPDAVTALLVDARSCLDHVLMRPAVQLMGVAYEAAIEHVIDAMIARGTLPAKAMKEKAAKRVALVKAAVQSVLTGTTPQEVEERFAVIAAYDFADQLRQRRNDASHTMPRYDFSDREEAEEFLISAGRHLPSLWRMHRP
ncbi:MAG TPA: hypothetical protein VGG39_02155 [Polyangiaceae bacterium]